jgi:hypothetical protein
MLVAGVLLLAAAGCAWWIRREAQTNAMVLAAADDDLAPLRQTLEGLRQVTPGTRDGRSLVELYGELFAWLGTALPRFGLEGRAEVPRASGVVDLARSFAGTDWPQIKSIDVTVSLVQWRFYKVVDLIGSVTRQFPVVQRSLVLAPKNARLVLTLYGRV